MTKYVLAIASLMACATMSTPAWAMGAAAKSVQLSKVMLDTETSEVTGKLKVGTICMLSGKFQVTKRKQTLNYEHFDTLFSDKMKGMGFVVLSKSSDLFASEQDSSKGDYLIGAVIHPVEENVCSSVNGMKGSLSVNIDWQVYDRAAQKIVFSTTIPGQGTVEKFQRDGGSQLINQAFVASLETLAKQGALAPYLGTPH